MKKKFSPVSKKITEVNIDKKKSVFNEYVDSKYFQFIIPSLYFLIMFFLAMFNRPLGGTGLETDFYWTYAPYAKEFLKGNLVLDQFHGPVY